MAEDPKPVQIVEALEDQWFKIAVLLMMKLKSDHEVITSEDVRALPPDSTIVAQELSDGIHLRLVPNSVALEIARRYKAGKP